MIPKTILPILAIAAVITGAVSMMPLENYGNDVIISSSVVDWTDEELIENTPFIVKGEITSAKTITEPRGEHKVVFTIWEVTVSESLKGDLPKGIIHVKTLGGQVGDVITHNANFADYHETDEVILFLDKETEADSYYGNQEYHLVTQNFGVFELMNGLAINDDKSKTQFEEELTEKISFQR